MGVSNYDRICLLGDTGYLLAEDVLGSGRPEVAFLRRQPGGLVDGGCPCVSDAISHHFAMA